MATLVILAVLVVLALWGVSVYNRMIQLENRYENAWSQIDVQLKRRADLVPNLVETVQGYASHERELFEEVARSRSALMNANGVNESAEAANMMSAALGRLFAVAEAYPELKANQNFAMLQEELSSIENKIAYARQFYNDAVLQFNNAIETVPGNFFAGPMGKKEAVFLEIPEENKAVPEVSFGQASQPSA
ncbi:MAG TPA: LemA family protein [Trueperaceae bacterium]|nr:LemA family protein [Trueperaceae bacterium]